MSDMNDWNKKVIEEFRANAGRVGGQFEGTPVLLLHTTGAKSGLERVNPVMPMARVPSASGNTARRHSGDNVSNSSALAT